MAVRKFRSVEEMEAHTPTWLSPDDPQLARSIRLCWELAAAASPIRFPPGVHKHRSIEALNRQTDQWESARHEPEGQAGQ